jgi:hypothetical protein
LQREDRLQAPPQRRGQAGSYIAPRTVLKIPREIVVHLHELGRGTRGGAQQRVAAAKPIPNQITAAIPSL